MTILTKAPISKGSPAVFTLNKADLLLNAVVAADAYYSDSNKWKDIVVVYTSSVGNQTSKVIFDATQVAPEADFLISLKARDVFEVTRIDIYDFDGGYLSVPRADLVTADFDADFDIDMGAASFPFARDFVNPNSLEANETGSLISIVGEDLVISPTGGDFPEYNRDLTVDGLSVVDAQSYYLRMYITAASAGNPAEYAAFSIGKATQGTGTAVQLSSIISAIGSYVDITMSGDPNQTGNFIISKTGNNSGWSMSISHYIISETPLV